VNVDASPDVEEESSTTKKKKKKGKQGQINQQAPSGFGFGAAPTMFGAAPSGFGSPFGSVTTVPNTNNPIPRPLTPLGQIVDSCRPEVAKTSPEQAEFNSLLDAQPHGASNLDFSATFLMHARLYHLATYHNISALQFLSLEKLLQKLLLLDPLVPETPVVDNIVELVKYFYDNIPARPNDSEPARKMVSTFVAKNMAAFAESGMEAEMLLREGGDFVVDICKKVVRAPCGRCG
jgi:hypothetical protein